MVVSRSRMSILGLVAVGLVAFAVAGLLRTGLARPAAAVPSSAPPPGQMEGSSLPILDLSALVRQADVVLVGRVAGAGTTRIMVEPAQTPIGQTRAVPGGQANGLQTPVTAYPIQVERTLRGLAPSQPLTVTQVGGAFTTNDGPGGTARTRTLEVPDDPPLKPGERYVLFLSRSADGAFSIVGGAQGRLLVDGANTLHRVGAGSPATQAFEGQPLDALVAAVAAAR